MGDVIKEGDLVMIKRDDNLKTFFVRCKRNVFMEKAKFTFNGAVGHPYGSMFEVKDCELVRVKQETISPEKDAEVMADNRDLHDVDSNQKLSRDEIEEMKDKGVEGGKIIEKLIEHSNTFQNKTEFSKAKYLKKKKKKFMKLFTILKPTTRLLCEMNYNKNRMKILGLRMDSIAQILAYANVRSGSNFILSENCGGLLLGAVLKRLGDEGKVLDFYIGSAPVRPEAPHYDREYYSKHVYSLPLNSVASLVKRLGGSAPEVTVKKEESKDEVPSVSSDPVEVKTEEEKMCVEEEDEGNKSENEAEDAAIEEKSPKILKTEDNKEEKSSSKRKEDKKINYEERKLTKERRIKEATELALQGEFDGLIVASKFHPKSIVLNLMKFLAPSRPIVVYSQFQEPLIECYKKLREQGNVVNLTLSETWLREYQVLPKRTHPTINMSGTGGFILTGIKVNS